MRSNKRLFWIILSVAMILSLGLAACQSTPAEEPVIDEPAEVVDEPVEADEPAEVEEPAEEMADEVFTIGYVTVGPWNDAGWSQLHHEGALALKEHYGDRIEIVGVENVPYGEEATQTIELLISQGADMIIDGVSAPPFVDPAVEAHPEIYFIGANGSLLEPPPPNYQFYMWHVGSYDYLLGIAAGMLTETNDISYVAPFDFPNIRGQMIAFHMGARSVNPDVTTHIVTLNSWYDPAGARTATEALINSGVDVIGGDMNDPTKVAVAEENGVWGLGAYSNDQKAFGPETYVNTYVYDFFEMWQPIVESIWDGSFEGSGSLVFYNLGDGVDIGEWGDNVPQDVIDAVMEAREQMLSGEITPFVGPVVDADGVEVLAEGAEFSPLEWALGLTYKLEGMEGLE
jgi:basic membrane protein A and related proteins